MMTWCSESLSRRTVGNKVEIERTFDAAAVTSTFASSQEVMRRLLFL